MVQSGKADAMLVDLPPAIAAVELTGGSLSCSVSSTTRPRTATSCPRSETDFGEAIVEALKAARGRRLLQEILTKWKTEGGAISDFAVNPASADDANTMTTNTVDRPGEINARPVRHPGRWVAIAVIAVSPR
jgi:hypothetical protein